MKSRVSIDVDHDNQPIIKIEYSASEDVRDKLVKKFLESFGGVSQWAEFWFVNDVQSMAASVYGQSNSTALVRPIPSCKMEEQQRHMDYPITEYKKSVEVDCRTKNEEISS